MHLALGNYSSATSYNLTLSSNTGGTQDYGGIAFSAHNVHPYDASNTNPYHSMAQITLPTPFSVTLGETLTVTATGLGGSMQRFGDGTLRMTLVGLPCPSTHTCSDGPSRYTCEAL